VTEMLWWWCSCQKSGKSDLESWFLWFGQKSHFAPTVLISTVGLIGYDSLSHSRHPPARQNWEIPNIWDRHPRMFQAQKHLCGPWVSINWCQWTTSGIRQSKVSTQVLSILLLATLSKAFRILHRLPPTHPPGTSHACPLPRHFLKPQLPLVELAWIKTAIQLTRGSRMEVVLHQKCSSALRQLTKLGLCSTRIPSNLS
jgi:hypothetical protein